MNLAQMKVMRSNNTISLIIFSLLWIGVILLDTLQVVLNLTDYVWSVIFVLFLAIIYIFRYVSKESIVSLYSLFFLTSILFLGGRFISIFLGFDGKPLFEMDFFVYRLLDNQEISKLFYSIVIGFLSLEIGFYISRIFFNRLNFSETKQILLNHNKLILYFILIFLFSLLGLKFYQSFKMVLSGGYLALFSGQSAEEYSYNFYSLLKVLFLALTGIFLSQKNMNIRKVFLVGMGIYFCFDIVLGGRGGFVCYLIFLMWYLHDCGNKQASVSKILAYLLGILLFLSTLVSFISLRVEATEQPLIQKVLQLLYDQGITLMVFNESMYIEKYPLVPLFQNFIPGFSFLYNLLIENIPIYERSMSAYISYSLNPTLFYNGNGLGWAFFADAYQYAKGNLVLFGVLIFAFSLLINFLQNNVNKNIIIRVITVSLVLSILFLPRAGLNTVFPLIAYILVSYILIQLTSRLMSR